MTEQATPPPPPAQPPGYPAPVGDGTAPGGHPQQASPATSSKGAGIARRIIGPVVVFAIIGIGGVAYKYVTGAPGTAKVGDCMSGQAADELKTTDCADAAAAHKIVGKVEDKTEAEASQPDICAAYPTAERVYWEGKKRGGKGYVLCLESVA